MRRDGDGRAAGEQAPGLAADQHLPAMGPPAEALSFLGLSLSSDSELGSTDALKEALVLEVAASLLLLQEVSPDTGLGLTRYGSA